MLVLQPVSPIPLAAFFVLLLLSCWLPNHIPFQLTGSLSDWGQEIPLSACHRRLGPWDLPTLDPHSGLNCLLGLLLLPAASLSCPRINFTSFSSSMSLPTLKVQINSENWDLHKMWRKLPLTKKDEMEVHRPVLQNRYLTFFHEESSYFINFDFIKIYMSIFFC